MTKAVRIEFGQRVKNRRLKHAAGKCEGCAQPLVKGRFQFDHDKCAAEGGDGSFENCRVLCSGGKATCHAIKTEKDQKRMAKADAVKNRYVGTTKAPTRRVASPPKNEREPRRVAAELPELPRRSLYK